MTTRSKTITWHDPIETAALGAQLSGIEFMRAMAAGEVPPPPISVLMNMGIQSIDEGRVVFTAEPDESQYNPLGRVHGGFVCTVLDTVAGCAVHTTLPQGLGYTSLEIKVTYVAGLAHDSGVLTAVGTVIKPGKRVAFAEGVITDAAGRTIATATSTLLVFPLPTA